MDDALLVRVLHGLADGDEQLQPAAERQSLLVAEPGDRLALDQLHDEVGPARVGRPGIEHPGDVRVIHQRQGLLLGLEAGDDLCESMPGLISFSADGALDRLGLLGEEHGSHAPLADGPHQCVRTDDAAGALGSGFRPARPDRVPWSPSASPALHGRQKRLDLPPQLGPPAQRALEVGRTR